MMASASLLLLSSTRHALRLRADATRLAPPPLLVAPLPSSAGCCRRCGCCGTAPLLPVVPATPSRLSRGISLCRTRDLPPASSAPPPPPPAAFPKTGGPGDDFGDLALTSLSTTPLPLLATSSATPPASPPPIRAAAPWLWPARPVLMTSLSIAKLGRPGEVGPSLGES